jgi:GT2 family glycosyltransferase
LNDTPPALGSRRFRKIAWAALSADPISAFKGLYWFLTRRRVRGWARLMTAAASAELSYRAWIEASEEGVFAAFRDRHPVGTTRLFIGLVLANGADAAEIDGTLQSLRAALPEAAPIVVASDRDPLASFAVEEEGAWLVPMFAGDRVSPHLGDCLERLLATEDAAVVVYWDEDRLGARGRESPWIKPDWDALLFGQLRGLTGSAAVRLSAFRRASDGSAIDAGAVETLLMQIAAEASGSVAHIPLVLTHRFGPNVPSADRLIPDPAPANFQWPKVSILLPTRDRPDLLSACLGGIERTQYPGPLELIIIDNGSADRRALELIEHAERDGATVLREPGPFNFSRLNNRAASRATGDVLCFLNNDVEPLTDDWLSRMVVHALDTSVGAVGALLLYPTGRIQHAGVAIGLGRAAGHVQIGVNPDDMRFWTWHQVTRRVSAVTAAVMVVRKEAFLAVGGFDEEAFPVAFNDVDMCLRLDRAGLRNIFVAEARLTHRESESRGDDRKPEHAERFAAELRRLQERWQTEDLSDPYFSPLFSRLTGRCTLAP